MAKTVIGLFDSFAEAQQVVQELANAGFPRDDISIVANNASGELSTYTDEGVADGAVTGATGGAVLGGVAGLLVGLGALAIPGVGPIIAAGPLAAALAGAGIGAATGGLLGALVDLGIPDEEAGYYAEGVRRGGALVSVRADEGMADTAVTIMERYNPVDVESRAAEWRQSGWTGYDENAGAYTGGSLGSAGQGSGTGTAATQSTAATSTGYSSSNAGTTQTRELNEGQVAIPVVEEEISIGKREVERGGVRVRSYVQEIPVEEQVSLREERVVVDRRPVDRAVTDADLTNFREGTIEVTETAEEAVVQKQGRVVEEVVVGKEVQERVETIRDTVRRTDVDVEEVNTGTRTSGTTDSTTYDTDFRNHFNTTYGSRGYTYDRYSPAYQYGYTLANDSRYSGRDWSAIETDARRDWESRGEGAWDDVKDAIRYGWNRVRNAV